jgi:hypothetical protein
MIIVVGRVSNIYYEFTTLLMSLFLELFGVKHIFSDALCIARLGGIFSLLTQVVWYCIFTNSLFTLDGVGGGGEFHAICDCSPKGLWSRKQHYLKYTLNIVHHLKTVEFDCYINCINEFHCCPRIIHLIFVASLLSFLCIRLQLSLLLIRLLVVRLRMRGLGRVPSHDVTQALFILDSRRRNTGNQYRILAVLYSVECWSDIRIMDLEKRSRGLIEVLSPVAWRD